jgi:hypothetical protein
VGARRPVRRDPGRAHPQVPARRRRAHSRGARDRRRTAHRRRPHRLSARAGRQGARPAVPSSYGWTTAPS